MLVSFAQEGNRMRNRILTTFATVAFCSLFFFVPFYHIFDSGAHDAPDLTSIPAAADFVPERVQPHDQLPSLATKPLGNPYSHLDLDGLEREYRRTLVIAKTKAEDTSWIEEQLSDILAPNAPLTTAIYVADDSSAPLHPPINKGHEAMVYLTYIIDHYDALPDIAIFMHFHKASWHNNDLLDTSAAEIVRRLSSEKVQREGYMNLRCHWEPGCPSWIHPQMTLVDDHKSEEAQFAKAFVDLFPNEKVPYTLAQPCCAQFAVSGERIRRLPKERYIAMRNWLEHTELDDYTSGRVFEYSWQYIFTSDPIHCRNMHICYCDGYSVCFSDEHAYVQWTDIMDTYRAYRDELADWRSKPDSDKVGEEGRDHQMQVVIDGLLQELDRRKSAAFELGRDREKKYAILSQAWEELKNHPPGHLAEKYGHFGVDSELSV